MSSINNNNNNNNNKSYKCYNSINMHTNSALITSVCPNKAATCNGEHPSSGRPVDIILDVCSSSSTDFIDDIAFCTTSVRPNSAA